jgi:hypothetical protein
MISGAPSQPFKGRDRGTVVDGTAPITLIQNWAPEAKK